MDRECKPTPEITGQNKGKPYTSPRKPQPLKLNKMKEELQKVADLITANTIFTTKEVLTSDEAAKYMGISKELPV
jgi:hypothetical protein